MDGKERENALLLRLMDMEDLAEKKASIYARLLLEPTLSKAMEEISVAHKERREGLERLYFGAPKTPKEGSRYALKGEKEEI